jgi:hypothetical protein
MKRIFIALAILISVRVSAEVRTCPILFNLPDFSLHHHDGPVEVFYNKKKTVSLAVGCEKASREEMKKAADSYRKLGLVVESNSDHDFNVRVPSGKVLTMIFARQTKGIVVEWSLSSNDPQELESVRAQIKKEFQSL